MNTSNEGGEFVIAGVAFHDASTEPLHWSSGRVAAVAPVDMTVAAGVTVTVDVARPSDVLEFTVHEFGDPSDLIAACDAGAAQLVNSVARGEEPGSASLTLQAVWARKAFVTGVERWQPRPIHEGALILDKAAALQAVGESAAAARLFALGSPVLAALAADCANGLLSELTVLELAGIARHAAEAVASLSWGPQIREIADQIEAETGLSELDADIALLQWSDTERRAFTYDFEYDKTAEVPEEAVVDPAAVTPRIIEWAGAEHAELHIVETADGDEVSAKLTVKLSDFVDEHSYEVGRVSAFVADADGGTLLRTVSTRLEDGRALSAELHYSRPDSGRVVYGIFDADKGVGVLRFGHLDSDLITIDRMMLDAWSTYRAALVLQARLGEAGEQHLPRANTKIDSLREDTQRLASDARSELSRVQSRVARREPSQGAALNARLAAIEAYEADVDAHGVVPSAGCEALLAELLPLTPET